MAMSHTLTLEKATQGERGAYLRDDFSKLDLASTSQIACPRCGTLIDVPDGSLRAHAQNHFHSTDYIKMVIHHSGGGTGKNPPPFPHGVRRIS